MLLVVAPLCAIVAVAEDAAPQAGSRPRVCLVLSGGGARGAAHIGVLKILEQRHIPIDCIAGTSMGAVVGGLYASGMTAAQIEQLMTSVDWQDAFRDQPPREQRSFRRKTEDFNFLVKFPLGLNARRFRLPKGLIQGQKLAQILRRQTLPVVAIADFDHLPIPFRAVATDLVTGEEVVLDSGDLAAAMRASLSAPGVFAPVEIDGRMLVDGGLVANLPVSVARRMKPDVLIVVDAGFPLQPEELLDSAPVISNQMLAILIRRNSDLERSTLRDGDILIEPELGNASSFDFSTLPQHVAVGAEAAAAQTRLDALGMNATQFAAHLEARLARQAAGSPVISDLQLNASARRYDTLLQHAFGEFVGHPIDPDALERRVSDIYGRGNLEQLDWRLLGAGEERRLQLLARRNSWGPNYVRFGLNLEDDFEGNSSFNAAARFVLSEITDRGGEWTWDFQLGERPRIATEVYLPLDYGPGFFLSPHVSFDVRNAALIQNQQRLAEFRVRTLQYGVDIGYELGNWGELRAGLRRENVRSRVRLGDPLLPEESFNAGSYFFRFSYDRLNDVNFPRRGQSFSLEWRGDTADLGSNETASLVEFNWLLAHEFGRNTAILWVSGGTNIDDANANVRTAFPLGGFLNLSGLAPGSITGKHFGIARALYYRQIGRGGSGFLDLPAYAGISLELGNVWDNRSDISFASARKNGSFFFGLDTLLGPIYLGTGFDDKGENAFYLFLGRTF